MAQLKEVRPVLTGVSVEEVSVEEGSAGEETEDSIFHGKKAKKRWPINWVSTAMAMSPGEIWIDMPFDGRLPEAARAFDGCETLTVYADENDQTGTVYAGYTKLTHMMLDTSLTLRLRKEEAHAADHA